MGECLLKQNTAGGNKVTFQNYGTSGTTVIIPVTAGSMYNFTGTDVTVTVSGTVSVTAPVSGYVKYKAGTIS